MKSIGHILTFCGLWLLTSCITIYHESPWEPVPPDVAATMTAMAPTRSPTIPPQPTATPEPDGEPQDYTGTFTSGFEVIAFKPCNSDEVWWLDGEIGPWRLCRRVIPH